MCSSSHPSLQNSTRERQPLPICHQQRRPKIWMKALWHDPSPESNGLPAANPSLLLLTERRCRPLPRVFLRCQDNKVCRAVSSISFDLLYVVMSCFSRSTVSASPSPPIYDQKCRQESVGLRE
ncbi:hypothetical protein B0H12DRAFT_344017 [Mycena haematopus]|nr:hypothetical protein B0H12DRAFT_344017 [Mycena haematopus]